MADDALVILHLTERLKLANRGSLGTALGKCERTLQSRNDFGNRDNLRSAGQDIPPLDAPMRFQQAVLQQDPQKLAYSWQGQTAFARQLAGRVRVAQWRARHLAHQQQTVIRELTKANHVRTSPNPKEI